MPGLAADRGVDHASSVVGTVTSRTPRNQVAATKPARSVVDSAAESDHRVGPGEAGGAEHRPAAGGHCGGLGGLGVGYVDPDRLDARRAQRATTRSAASIMRRRVQHGHPLDPVTQHVR